MDVNRIITNQYKAALSMMHQAVEKCPEGLWYDKSKGFPIWQLCYHALFYTDLYLHKGRKNFSPWEQHRENSQHFRNNPAEPEKKLTAPLPYMRSELQDYLRNLVVKIENKVPEFDMKAPSAFEWLPFNRLELHFYNIRHLQHHTAQIVDRLRNHGEVEIQWVISG